jgi:alpha-ketoglutarate-dependent taurine dioxygenase
MAKSMVLPDIRPMTPAVGAIVTGLDLREPLEPETVLAVRAAVLEHGVVFFREQDLTRDQMLAFMVNFGTPCVDPISVAQGPVPGEATIHDLPTRAYAPATAVWHIDSSLGPAPASLMGLRAVEVPPIGGDTCWASMYAAYDALSEPMRDMLDGLTALHSAYKVLPLMGGSAEGQLQEDLRSIHPVVRVHPETGRKALFANELWTERIVELSTAESDALLAFLFEHVKSPEFSIRWQWQEHDLAFWDNRSFAHHAINDYTEHRVMQKSLLAGDRPYGPR